MMHETHVCRDCGAVITLPYTRQQPSDELADGLRRLVEDRRRVRGTLAKVNRNDWLLILWHIFGAHERPKVRHGRHCPCSACAREDWTNPALSPCDYHGVPCPYSPGAES